MQTLKRHGVFATLLICILAFAVWLWGFGGAADITRWAASQQRDVQGALAGSLRAIRGGDTSAILGLLGLCFAYGFFHAAGPGHGKLVMGGYALGEDIPRARVVALTLAGSLGQAVTAILLVGIGGLIVGWGRAQMVGLADGAMAGISAGAVVLVGLWLVLRGMKRWRGTRALHAHAHHDHHGHDHHHADEHGVCQTCGHAHGPSMDQIEKATTWKDGIGVVFAVAIRPCTGALFVLILTFGMGIPLIGVLGAIAMAIGTAMLTILVALGAWHLRGGLAERLDGPTGLRAMAVVEICAGIVVALIAGQLAARLLFLL